MCILHVQKRLNYSPHLYEAMSRRSKTQNFGTAQSWGGKPRIRKAGLGWGTQAQNRDLGLEWGAQNGGPGLEIGNWAWNLVSCPSNFLPMQHLLFSEAWTAKSHGLRMGNTGSELGPGLFCSLRGTFSARVHLASLRGTFFLPLGERFLFPQGCAYRTGIPCLFPQGNFFRTGTPCFFPQGNIFCSPREPLLLPQGNISARVRLACSPRVTCFFHPGVCLPRGYTFLISPG